MTNVAVALGVDVVSIVVLVYCLYFRRHFRRDLTLAYVTLNVGVLAVTDLLAGSQAGLGLGLGLFGILSIIRLRSDAITQEEVAYYFASLALGLVNGLHPGPVWLSPALSVLLVGAVYLADHPWVARRTRRQLITLDVAYPREAALRAALERLLGGPVLHVVVMELDLVRDMTIADVRFRIPDSEDERASSLDDREDGLSSRSSVRRTY